ncbi:hypothetical protein OIDMADRAFT_19811 [Oidiodendron maius Zn]|uniref:Uncharacterized protein n=1 Tax=Oidiodendron maius (strain Zn) TaxID=913774 RepID=A0A0C3DD73_OIDMZ|nr:hypothetical protein OIDMADRAFT_19811 [Oidiodendron maius Zn]
MKFLSVAVISTISIFILGGSAVPTGSIFENIKTDPESYEICARDPTSKRCEGVNGIY